VIARWRRATLQKDTDRTAKAFFVPVEEIRENGYDLSINRLQGGGARRGASNLRWTSSHRCRCVETEHHSGPGTISRGCFIDRRAPMVPISEVVGAAATWTRPSPAPESRSGTFDILEHRRDRKSALSPSRPLLPRMPEQGSSARPER